MGGCIPRRVHGHHLQPFIGRANRKESIPKRPPWRRPRKASTPPSLSLLAHSTREGERRSPLPSSSAPAPAPAPRPPLPLLPNRPEAPPGWARAYAPPSLPRGFRLTLRHQTCLLASPRAQPRARAGLPSPRGPHPASPSVCPRRASQPALERREGVPVGRPAAPRPLLTHPTPAGPPPPSQGGGGFARGGRGSGEGGMRARPRAATLPPCQKQETRKRAPPSPGQTRTPLGRRGGGEARAHPAQPKDQSRGTFDAGVHPPPQKKNSPAWEEEKRGRGGAHARPRRPCPVATCRTRSPPPALPSTQMTTPQRRGVCAPLASHRARGRPPFLPASPPSGHKRARAPLVARRPPPPRPPARPPTHATQHAPRKHTRKGTHTRTREREVPSHPPSQARACPKASPTPPRPPLAGEGGGGRGAPPAARRPAARAPPPAPSRSPTGERVGRAANAHTSAPRFPGRGVRAPHSLCVCVCVCVCVVGCVGVGGGAGGRRREVRARVCVRVGVRDARGEGAAPCAVRGMQHAPSKGRGGASGGEREWKGQAGGAWPGGGGRSGVREGHARGHTLFFFQKPSPSIEVGPRGRE